MEEKEIGATLENRLADPFDEYVPLWLKAASEDIKALQDEYFSQVKK